MKIGLIDVDGHNFPNLALMKISAWHKVQGDQVSWVEPLETYDRVYKSKIFTFTQDENLIYDTKEIVKGGTGYDITSKLESSIDNMTVVDYSIYRQYQFSIQFYSRGCIRKCPFCLVSQKEGFIKPCSPLEWNPKSKWIEVLDNNFFANPLWRIAIDHLRNTQLPIKFHGVDLRLINEEQAKALSELKLKNGVHVAWDFPEINLIPQIEFLTRYIKPSKIVVYVLIGFNSTKEQDLWRVREIKKLGALPFVQAYRDYENHRRPTQYEKDFMRWANRAWLFKSMDFLDYKPRKNFKCSDYYV